MSKSVDQEFKEFRKLVSEYLDCIAGVPMDPCDVDQDEEEELAGKICRCLEFYEDEELDLER